MVTQSANVVRLPNEDPSWIADIQEHAKLISTYRALRAMKKTVAAKLKACQRPDLPKRDAYKSLASLPHKVRTRMALRYAIEKTRKKEEATPLASDVLMQEFAYLTKRQKDCRARILELESRVLTAQPSSTREAKRLLNFISKLVAAGRKIDKRYFADALEECAFAIDETANTHSQKVLYASG